MRPRSLAGVAAGLAAGFAAGCTPTPPGPPADAPEPPPFTARLVDVTDASGLTFVHATGQTGDKLLPETMGSGCALLDYDGDGHLDLFLVNSGAWPDEPVGEETPRCALYRGRGDGTFVDVSRAAGADLAIYGMGVAVGDVDGDGDPDLYVTALGDNVLLVNDGGTFRDATREAGVAGGRWRDAAGRTHSEWSSAACFVDVDLDGDLDLFVGNYCCWTRELEIFTTLDGTTKAFTTPDRYTGLACRLFLGDGRGGFEDVSEAAGLSGHLGKALGVVAWDFDGDGLPELCVANDTRPDFYFQNLGGARFEERGVELGFAYDENGRARAGMGIDVARLSGEEPSTVAIGNFSGEPMSLHRRMDEGGFRPFALRAGLGTATYEPLTFGVAFCDLDLDGLQDLVLANGHIEPEIARFRAGSTYAQAAQVFQGLPSGSFRDVSAEVGPDFARPLVGRGLAVGDLDADGDLDLCITQNGGPAALWRNDTRHGWVRVEVPDGAGAPVVTLTAGGWRQVRQGKAGGSYLSSSAPHLTFGLGEAPAAERVVVRFQDGTEQVHEDVPAGTVLRVRRE